MKSLAIKILVFILCVVLSLGVGGYLGYHFTSNYLIAQFNHQKDLAKQASDDKINQLTVARDKIENKQAADAKQEQDNYETQIDTLHSTIASLRASNAKLHDPGKRRQNRSSTRTASSTGASDQQSGGTLSPAATDFLFSFAERADTVRLSLITCQADDASVRKAVGDYNESLQKIGAETTKQAINSEGK